jgi:hypothetical protein
MALRESGTPAGPDTASRLGTRPRDLDLRPVPGPVPLQPAPWRRRARAAVARTDNPGVTALVTLAATTGFVLARWDMWSQRTISRFILIGQHFAHPAQLPPGMPLRAAYGYDGQFFYRLAINPFNFSHSAYGITVDRAYRFMRVGYPALTWLCSFGQRALVPYMLVVVNVAALTALAAGGAVIARQGGRHAAWGLLLPAYFGLVTSLSRDTAEPVAAAFLVAGLLAIRGRRPVLAGSLLAFAALTRETAMVAVAALALLRVAGLIRGWRRPGRDDVAWVLPAAVFAAWQVLVYAVIGTFPLLADGGRNAGAPFIAPFEALRTNLGSIDWTSYNSADLWLAEMAVLLVFAIAALCSLQTSRAPAHERLALVLFLFEICLVTPDTWSSRSADLRSFVEVYLMAVIVLLGRPRQRMRRPGGWLLPVAAVGLLPVLGDIAGLRLHWA